MHAEEVVPEEEIVPDEEVVCGLRWSLRLPCSSCRTTACPALPFVPLRAEEVVPDEDASQAEEVSPDKKVVQAE